MKKGTPAKREKISSIYWRNLITLLEIAKRKKNMKIFIRMFKTATFWALILVAMVCYGICLLGSANSQERSKEPETWPYGFEYQDTEEMQRAICGTYSLKSGGQITKQLVVGKDYIREIDNDGASFLINIQHNDWDPESGVIYYGKRRFKVRQKPELSIWDSDECAWFSKGGEPLEIITDYSTEAETQADQGVFIVREKEGMHTCNARFCNRRTNKYLLGPMNRKYYYCWEHYYEYKKKLTVLREPYADDAQ